MSSNPNFSQGNFQPGQPQPPGPQGPPPVHPYVEGAPPQAPGGGQPPVQPPGGYAPMPPPQPPKRRKGPIILASILAVALLAGVGAFVLFNFVFKSGPDPAEQFPASSSMYMEVNLDPSMDQTPKLLDHLNKFGGLDFDDPDDMLADLLDESELEGVDADEDLNSWLGRRHGMAMWEHDGQPYGVVNLASTDSDKAEAGLENIRDAAGASDDQWAYSVGDDSVLMVVGDEGASDALAAAESEAESDALSDASGYDEARSWLDGDQLVVLWADVDALVETAASMGEKEELEALDSMFSGHFVLGVSAFDDGFEASYRAFGEGDHPWTGSEDLMANMGDLPASDFAVSADVPENLDELSEEWATELEDLAGGDMATEEPGEGEGTQEPGEEGQDTEEPAGDPLTIEEYEEYQELDEQWWDDTLAPEDEDRHAELEERYFQYGYEDPDAPAGDPLTAEEYEEYLQLDEQWWDDTLAPEDEDRHAELEDRFFQYGTEDGVEEDDGFDEFDDPTPGTEMDQALGAVTEIIDLLAGAQLNVTGDLPAQDGEMDPETIFLSALLAEDRADDLDALVTELSGGAGLPEGVEVDGSNVSYQGGNVADGTLSDDERFSSFADSAPGSAGLGLWVDLSGISEYPEFEAAEPLSAFAFAHGTEDGDGTGLVRLYLD